MRPIIARETSLSAMCGRLRVGKDVLHARRLRSNDEWSPVARDFGQLTLLRLLRSPIGTKRTGPSCRSMSAFGGKADIAPKCHFVRL